MKTGIGGFILVLMGLYGIEALMTIRMTVSECDDEFWRRNFTPSKYTDSRENVMQHNDTNPDAGSFALTPEDLEDL